jgi:hypothetical protein
MDTKEMETNELPGAAAMEQPVETSESIPNVIEETLTDKEDLSKTTVISRSISERDGASDGEEVGEIYVPAQDTPDEVPPPSETTAVAPGRIAWILSPFTSAYKYIFGRV